MSDHEIATLAGALASGQTVIYSGQCQGQPPFEGRMVHSLRLVSGEPGPVAHLMNRQFVALFNAECEYFVTTVPLKVAEGYLRSGETQQLIETLCEGNSDWTPE